MLSSAIEESPLVLQHPVITPFINDNTYLTSHITIGELPNYDTCVTPETSVRVVAEILEKRPGLPGVIIVDAGRCLAMLSRGAILESLSRPFGTELFLNRPIKYMLRNVLNTTYILPSTKRIDEAVQIALNRPIKDMYEPFVIQYSDKQYRLLDFYVLILAQAQLLTNANFHIEKQVKTGRALSNILEIEELVCHILDDLDEIVPYDQATIVLINAGNTTAKYESCKNKDIFLDRIQDVINDDVVKKHIIQLHKPIIVNNTLQGNEYPFGKLPNHIKSWLGYPFMYSDKITGIISLTRFMQNSRDGQLYKNYQTGKIINEFTENDITLLASMEPTYSVAIRNAQLHSELENLSITDPLTGIQNRRGFFKSAYREMESMIAIGQNISVLMVDIDYFKRVNDFYGHLIGDQVIKIIATECSNRLREKDIIGRYGGEEFAIVLPGSDLEAARSVADRLRYNIAQLKIETERGPLSVTVSIGVTHYISGASLDTLLQQADEALYQAKGFGRNRVEVWNSRDLSVFPGLSKEPPTLSAPNINKSINILPEPSEWIIKPSGNDQLIEEMVIGWARLLELKDKETEGHATRVAEVTTQLAREIGMDGRDLKNIYRGALLHDIGKIGIPDEILFKPEKLSDSEWEVMRKHPDYAYQILSPIGELNSILSIPLCHHEKWDGTGYPRGIKGKEIPIEARLFAMVDVWDALSSDRVYRPAWGKEQIHNYFLNQAGFHFDPDLVTIFLDYLEKNKKI